MPPHMNKLHKLRLLSHLMVHDFIKFNFTTGKVYSNYMGKLTNSYELLSGEIAKDGYVDHRFRIKNYDVDGEFYPLDIPIIMPGRMQRIRLKEHFMVIYGYKIICDKYYYFRQTLNKHDLALDIDHINRIRNDNRLENLRLVTRKFS